MSLPKGHKGRPLLIMSHGLIHKNKGYHRIVRNLRQIIDEIGGKQKVILLIMGMEHSNNVEQHIMPSLLEEATALGVRPHIVWHSEYSSQSDISKWLALADVYASMYEEVAPTSGALLQAMAHGCAIVATSYRYAVEVLTDHRGLTVPFEDDAQIQAAFVSLLQSSSLRQQLGKNAARFASQWTWDKVAIQYRLLLAAAQESRDHTENYLLPPFEKSPSLQPLTPDPFRASYHLDSELYQTGGVKKLQDFTALWSAEKIVTFHENELFSGGDISEEERISPGMYAVYADQELQVNGVIERSESYAFSKVGLRWGAGVRILVDVERGVQIQQGDEGGLVEVVEGRKEGGGGKPITLFRGSERRRILSVNKESIDLRANLGSQKGDVEKDSKKLEISLEATGSDAVSERRKDVLEEVISPNRFDRLEANRNGEELLVGQRQLESEEDPFYHQVILQTGQVTVKVTVSLGKEVTVKLTNPIRFDHPHGLLGQTVRCAWDLPARTTGMCPATFRKELYVGDTVSSLNPDVWRVARSESLEGVETDVFSTAIPGQEWEIWGVYFNEREEDQLWLKGAEFEYTPRKHAS